MGHVSDNMANATNLAVERMKQNRAAKEAAARDAEKRTQAGRTPANSYNAYFPKI
jgi:hypothetical protein